MNSLLVDKEIMPVHMPNRFGTLCPPLPSPHKNIRSLPCSPKYHLISSKKPVIPHPLQRERECVCTYMHAVSKWESVWVLKVSGRVNKRQFTFLNWWNINRPDFPRPWTLHGNSQLFQVSTDHYQIRMVTFSTHSAQGQILTQALESWFTVAALQGSHFHRDEPWANLTDALSPKMLFLNIGHHLGLSLPSWLFSFLPRNGHCGPVQEKSGEIPCCIADRGSPFPYVTVSWGFTASKCSAHRTEWVH